MQWDIDSGNSPIRGLCPLGSHTIDIKICMKRYLPAENYCLIYVILGFQLINFNIHSKSTRKTIMCSVCTILLITRIVLFS